METIGIIAVLGAVAVYIYMKNKSSSTTTPAATAPALPAAVSNLLDPVGNSLATTGI